jgi:broad specificity phosphatase PhoE
VTLIVLRHGHIASHEGDLPLTQDGRTQATRVGQWFAGFLTDADPVGYWTRHVAPPGDTALVVGRRIAVFLRSLTRVPYRGAQTIVGFAHSPVLRAIALTHLGADVGEPPYLHGYRMAIELNGGVSVSVMEPRHP